MNKNAYKTMNSSKVSVVHAWLFQKKLNSQMVLQLIKQINLMQIYKMLSGGTFLKSFLKLFTSKCPFLDSIKSTQ